MEQLDKSHRSFLYRNTMPEWWTYIDMKREVLKVKKGYCFIEENTAVEGCLFC